MLVACVWEVAFAVIYSNCVASDAEVSDAPEPEGNASDVDVVPDSYAPAKHRQKRRKAMLSDSDDE